MFAAQNAVKITMEKIVTVKTKNVQIAFGQMKI